MSSSQCSDAGITSVAKLSEKQFPCARVCVYTHTQIHVYATKPKERRREARISCTQSTLMFWKTLPYQSDTLSFKEPVYVNNPSQIPYPKLMRPDVFQDSKTFQKSMTGHIQYISHTLRESRVTMTILKQKCINIYTNVINKDFKFPHIIVRSFSQLYPCQVRFYNQMN